MNIMETNDPQKMKKISASVNKQNEENYLEFNFVKHLSEILEIRLADRGGERHNPGWEPRQNVVLGVLESHIIQSDLGSEGERADELDEMFISDNSIGFDFVVCPASNNVHLRVNLDFAIYCEEYPTVEEQRSYAHPEIEIVEHTENKSMGSEKRDNLNISSNSHRTHERALTRLVSIWRRYDILIKDIKLSIPLNGDYVCETNSIDKEIHKVIDGHFERSEVARPFLRRTREVPTSSLESEEAFQEALKNSEDSNFSPLYPGLRLTGYCQRLPDESYLVSLSITNVTILPDFPFQDLSVYDCRMHAWIDDKGKILPQRFRLAPKDYRYNDINWVVAHGRNCFAVAADSGISITTLPCFIQHDMCPRSDHIKNISWRALSNDPFVILDDIENAMESYLQEWDQFLQRADSSIKETSRIQRNNFKDEIRRFKLGIRAMHEDPRLKNSFRLANQVFDKVNEDEDFDSWRLFQIVFIVSQLPALAARECNDAEMQSELNFADVLWFPTGGGKTEAYLGLIVCALFYDRMRGKKHGLTAWLKFPLRMLSVQQLSRVLKVLVVAENIRMNHLEECKGDSFGLGYLVGSSNTPNSLVRSYGWWPGIEAASELEESKLDDFRLVTECPFCGGESVRLRADLEYIRLLHVCDECKTILPLYISDEEIYRYMPAVVVGTIDKLTGFSFFGEFTQFSLGPRFHCPRHGWFTFKRGGNRCLVENYCEEDSYSRVEQWYDPVPTLIIQDELHLVREELGAFDAHYEGLLVELQREGPSKLPSKIIAASATIENYEDQLRQVYGRYPRCFPTIGFNRRLDFYTLETPDIRRLFIGVLPHYRRKADVAAIIQCEIIEHLQQLQKIEEDFFHTKIRKNLTLKQIKEFLFNYEVTLGYVNSKTHGDQIAEEIARLSERLESSGGCKIPFKVLTGEVTVSELAEAINRIEQETLKQPRSERLQALVGTSVISHGVDLERLNIMVLAGLPTTTADYIQSTSRSGRTHAGIVATVFDVFSRRERSTFTHFESFHRFLNRMVEPVPVNKYAFFAASRTLPGIVMALFWDLCRRDYLGDLPQGIGLTRWFSQWWNRNKDQLKTILKQRIESCYRAYVKDSNNAILEDDLINRVLHRWDTIEIPQIQRFDADRTRDLFRERVLSSFRDIDIPVDFDAFSQSSVAFELLSGCKA